MRKMLVLLLLMWCIVPVSAAQIPQDLTDAIPAIALDHLHDHDITGLQPRIALGQLVHHLLLLGGDGVYNSGFLGAHGFSSIYAFDF